MDISGNVSLRTSNNSGIANANGSSRNLNTFEFYKTEQVTFLSILLIIIVNANIVVLVIIYLSRKMRSPMNIFIANLAAADLLVGLLFVSVDIVDKVTMEWLAGDFMCKIVKYSQAVATYGSTNALVALSIDRLVSVAMPFKAIGKGNRVRILIFLQWFFAFIFSCPMFLFHTKEYKGKTMCIMNLNEEWMWKTYMILITFAVFIIPAIIIALCYIIIVVVIWKKSSSFYVGSREGVNEQTRIIAKDANSENSTPLKSMGKRRVHWTEAGSSSRGLIPKAKIKTIKMTFVIVSAFIFCWSPYFIFNLLQVYGHIPRTQGSIAITVFIQSLAPLNSAANPLIYLLFNSQTYIRLCKRKKTPASPSSTQISQV